MPDGPSNVNPRPHSLCALVAGLCAFFFLFGDSTCTAGVQGYFTIQVVDAATGRGVPLVELRTVNEASWWTDSNGLVAFDEPGLRDVEVFFHVSSPGYEMPEDFFHNRGVRLKPERGGSAVVRIHRLNIAERLYRITGQGIYRDSVPDEHGVERLVARMANVPGLAPATDFHLLVFNDEKEIFEPIQRWDVHDSHRSAHPFLASVDGIKHYYIYPDIRVPADLRSLADLGRYEVFTCLADAGHWHSSETEVDRDASGHIRYTWKAGADRLQGERLDELVKAGKLKQEETWSYLLDFDTGAPLTRGLESVAWNEFRQRWIAFFADRPGEVWFSEADTPLGPWGYGRRVATHGEYNFYNIAHHPFFNQDHGRLVYFEGTYSTTFSGARCPTPRYDYNQLLYRLALDDARLILPVAVYRVRGTKGATHLWLRDRVQAAEAWERIDQAAFFALPPTRRDDVVPVYAVEKDGTVLSTVSRDPNARPMFVGLPLAELEPLTTLRGLWDCRASTTMDGNELTFPLEFSVDGETVRVTSAALEAPGSGTFRDGKLTLSLKTQDGTFLLDGRLDARSLTGMWRQEGNERHGTWSASPVDTTPAERRSPALVVLREYRRLAEGRPCYSTDPQPPAGYDPSGRPLCRVWKVPNPVLTPDGKTKPVPCDRW